jgi:invasion protein IalB
MVMAKSMVMAMSAATLAACACLAAAWPREAAAQARRFEDWEVVCAGGADASAQDCQATQRLAAPDGAGGEKVVFAASVVRAAKTPQETAKAPQETAKAPPGAKTSRQAAPSLVMILSAPLGGYLVPGVELKLDGRATARLLFETCNAAGCHGGFVLTPAYRRAFERAKAMQARLWVGKAKPVDVTISLKGFGPALNALEAGPAPKQDAR